MILSESESCSVVSGFLKPHGLYSPWNSPGQNTGGGSRSLLQGNLPYPGIKPRSPALQADSLPSEPPEKPIKLSLMMQVNSAMPPLPLSPCQDTGSTSRNPLYTLPSALLKPVSLAKNYILRLKRQTKMLH